jgi:tRNA-binding protein
MSIADGFFATDIRVGTIVEALPFPEARKPAIKVAIDFGPELGIKWSSAQITTYYSPESLVGRQVIAATNLGSRKIAGFTSEVLVLGAMESSTQVILLAPERAVPNGSRIA